MKAINIISFDVPYPANYGGIIDVFYKLKHFHKNKIEVHLHCFEYGKGEQKELTKYCASITYYQRKTGVQSQLSSLPYIVQSRTSKKLKGNLLKNNFPILFEGLHCCFLLDDVAFKNRFKIVRNHNVEHDYYNGLGKIESSPIKRSYFKIEAKKLKKFEPILKNANLGLTVSSSDYSYFTNKYPNNKFIHIPCFHTNEEVSISSKKGDYVLYHGNLSVAENKNAVKHIINNLFQNINIPLKIAGLNPDNELVRLIDKYPHITLIKNPNDNQLNELISNAQINLLYTEQATGLKLKLLNALYKGKHCIVNSKIVTGTSLVNACIVEDDLSNLKKCIVTTFSTPFDSAEIEKRISLLQAEYSNENNFKKLINVIN